MKTVVADCLALEAKAVFYGHPSPYEEALKAEGLERPDFLNLKLEGDSDSSEESIPSSHDSTDDSMPPLGDCSDYSEEEQEEDSIGQNYYPCRNPDSRPAKPWNDELTLAI